MQEWALLEASKCIVYIRERHYFTQVCTFQKAIKNVEVKVDVQKGALGFKGKTYNIFVSFIQSMFSSIVVI